MKIPLGFPVAMNDADLADFFSQWIRFMQGDAVLEQIYNYWIMGEGAEEKNPRWSILRNVIGWGVESTADKASGGRGTGG